MSIIAFIEGLRPSELTDALYGLLRRVYHRSGVHMHINHLPEEILLMIFKIVFQGHERDTIFKLANGRRNARVKSMAVVLTISHVCRIWRAIVLAHPCFWTCADGRNRDLLDTFLERAGSIPLSLFVTTRTHRLHELLASHGQRIKRLDLTVCDGAAELGDLTFVHGGSLESFTLTHERPGTSFQHTEQFFLFGERILPLAALFITPYAGRFPANNFPNLTHLWLEFEGRTRRDVNEPPPLSSTFFDFLSNTPKLEFMTLCEVGNNVQGLGEEADNSFLPIRLHHLRSLVFTMGDWGTVGMILSRLSIPDTTILRLLCDLEPTPDLPSLALPNVVRSIDHLRLITNPTYMLLVADSPSSGMWLTASIWERIFDDEHARVNWSGWLDSLPSTLPLGQITTLEISVGGQRDILSNLLPKMSGLVELSVRFDSDDYFGEEHDMVLARWLFEALAQEDPLICPDLRVLNIDVGGDSPDLYPVELELMVTFRSRIAHHIRRLVIQPFADMDTIDEASYEHVTRRLEPLKAVVEDLKVPGPGLPAIPSDFCCWRHYVVDGSRKYWS